MDRELLARASEYWRTGQPQEAGHLILDALPVEDRPKWAARALKLVLDKSGFDVSTFSLLLYTADHKPLWGNGHRAFSTLRDSTLEIDKKRKLGRLSKQDELFGDLLALGELVAKVTYNSACPPDPFDEDSGWWIVACLRGFVDVWNDEQFSRAAWDVLSSPPGS